MTVRLRARAAERRVRTVRTLALLTALGALMSASERASADSVFPVPQIPYAPRHAICYRATAAPVIDGSLEDPAWRDAAWTEEFVDIEGPLRPVPPLRTRAKLLWDDSFLYVGAQLEEPHLWATYTQRDAVIYHENDFEVFLDPDGDTHHYYELEINALNTVWDLLLLAPYRDGGPAVNAWDIAGLRTAVHLEGTLNDPIDRDRGWSVEIALPWAVLAECAHRPTPPEDGDQWRINFSRVAWDLEIVEGGYRKRLDPQTGRPRAEHNWVWSPQGLIAMHYPEMWGIVQFSSRAPSAGEARFVPDPDELIAWDLRRVYYAQKERAARGLAYTGEFKLLDLSPERRADLVAGRIALHVWPGGFVAVAPAASGGRLEIDTCGRLLRLTP